MITIKMTMINTSDSGALATHLLEEQALEQLVAITPGASVC